MPKGRKQKTTVKKKKKSSTSKKKPIARKKKTKKRSSKAAKVSGAITASQLSAVGIEQDDLIIEDFADVSQERASIISIVRGLEGQVETAFKLKEVLETELDATQKKLAEELDTHAQLEAQVTSLEAQAALAEQLRGDIAFVEEERNKFANQSAQIRLQLETAADERDKLAELITTAEDHTKETEGEKIALEAQVMNLKDKITDAGRLNKELMEVTEAHQSSREQVHDLTRRLEASEASKDALEMELAGTHQNARALREELEELREKIAAADSRTADLRIQLEDQQAANRELMEANTRFENEVKTLKINTDAARGELDTFKNALRDIRSEVTQTSGRVRQRYFKPNKPSSSLRKRPQSLSSKVN
ncbi:MAG: hypothetical protein ACYSRZ_05920 [Planctomycetota bacterium]|jgi:chromosome segregation ATPase